MVFRGCSLPRLLLQSRTDVGFRRSRLFNFKSNLPIVTAYNLLRYNSPHNAPMWRKQLHHELGDFDSSFESAGDYEFWLRCIAQGKTFFKLNTPHVVYYSNPGGISTKPDTKGVIESRRLLSQYSTRLISKNLT